MDIRQLDNHQLQAMLKETADIQLLDVRTPPEYVHLGHIPSAMLMPLQLLPQMAVSLDKSKPTVVVCEHGIRSVEAYRFLSHLGFENLYNLTAGMAEWDGERSFQHPTDSNSNEEIKESHSFF